MVPEAPEPAPARPGRSIRRRLVAGLFSALVGGMLGFIASASTGLPVPWCVCAGVLAGFVLGALFGLDTLDLVLDSL
jgi:ABC-type uncharacterized transport system permease subunit